MTARPDNHRFSPRLPWADAVSVGVDVADNLSTARERSLRAVATDAMWNELMHYARTRPRPDWRPPYRFRWIGGHVTAWDVEWLYHLPFPFSCCEWFDMRMHEIVHRGHRIKPAVIDHADEILSKLSSIGFSHEARGDVVRIWGYEPKTYDDFPPA